MLNADDDGDGKIDEDCSGWADTSYMDSCESDDDCRHYGQMFDCVGGRCTCPRRYQAGVNDSRGWFYDQLDGLCWRRLSSSCIVRQIILLCFAFITVDCRSVYYVISVLKSDACQPVVLL